MSKYYALLTGSKNNAGDYLIKERAKALLRACRPDREFLDIDGWKPLTDEQLEQVNGSEALLLTGGPSLIRQMRPGVYALREALTDIRVPITTFGVGWNAPDGRISRASNYPFNGRSLELLQRIEADGLCASVRDYHSLCVLESNGLSRVKMTACPANYSVPDLDRPLHAPDTVSNVTVSAGVLMAKSGKLLNQAFDLIDSVARAFPQAQVTVAFHHAVDNAFKNAYGRLTRLYFTQQRLIDWLRRRNLAYTDLSGSHSLMLEHYSRCDLHVGYRVHAHILMTSLRKPSLLLAEDGRGIALAQVLGGHIYPAFEEYSDLRGLYEFWTSNMVAKAVRRALWWNDAYRTDADMPANFLRILEADLVSGWPKARLAITATKNHWNTMQEFLTSLP